MYRTLIAAAAFAALSLGTVSGSHAQGFALQPLNGPEQTTVQMPGDNVQRAPTGEVKEGEVEASERSWVWVNSCWSRWYFVGYSRWGIPLYRRYASCY